MARALNRDDLLAARAGVDAMLRLSVPDRLLRDPNLADTPRRVVDAFYEMTMGYEEKPESILSTTFPTANDDMVVVRGIRFVSLCAHHLLPFVGTCVVGYLPVGRVVGLSKIPRLVECYSRRLQLQEDLTAQIAHAMQGALGCAGVGVVMKAQHACMACRGVRQQDADMVTSCLLGNFKEVPEVRAEFLTLAHSS